MDEEPGIRANTTILLGNLASHLSEAACKRVLLNAFTRALKDTFPPARIAGVRASSESSFFKAYVGALMDFCFSAVHAVLVVGARLLSCMLLSGNAGNCTKAFLRGNSPASHPGPWASCCGSHRGGMLEDNIFGVE